MSSTLSRYERKYFTHEHDHSGLETRILLHPVGFREIYYSRQVVSIYFDTPDYGYYYENVIGAPRRRKVRVRWYRDLNEDAWAFPAQQPPDQLALEIKSRTGETMYKKSTSFTYDPTDPESHQEWLQKLTQYVQSELQTQLAEAAVLQPVLCNTYERRYFWSERTNVRITVDHNLQFATLSDWSDSHVTRKLQGTVVECKYKVEQDGQLANIAQWLPLRVSKSSKYVLGVQQCTPQIQ